MSSSSVLRGANSSNIWLHRRIYYLACGFMFAAAALRALLAFPGSPVFHLTVRLLAAWLFTCVASMLLAGRFPCLSAVLIGLEVAIIAALVLSTNADFFVLLFAISCMQAMQQWTARGAAILVGLTTLLAFLSLVQSHGVLYALGMALVYFGGSILLVAYIGSTRRASLIEAQQQALVAERQRANCQLEEYSEQLEQLAAARERQRLARELHDSVTQTLFSMTLTTQSALLLLDRDRQQVGSQLERLNQLTQSTLSEMQILISKLAPENLTSGRLVTYLQQHLEERRRLDGLSIGLEVEGSEPLEPAEEAGLFRIAQEALNNIVKHARVCEAVLRLHLCEPFWMEIEDQGIGFDPQAVRGAGGVGLESMRERATDIGWNLKVRSFAGFGTRIWVEKEPGGGTQV